jgi:hypothetical protein
VRALSVFEMMIARTVVIELVGIALRISSMQRFHLYPFSKRLLRSLAVFSEW